MQLLTEHACKPPLGGNRLRTTDPRHDCHEPGVINAL